MVRRDITLVDRGATVNFPFKMASNLPITGTLLEAFTGALAANSSVRFLKIAIEDEKLVLDKQVDRMRHASADFDTLMKPLLTKDAASMVVFKVSESKWLLVAWTPDTASVRDKMLYSSARDHMKKALVSAGGDFEPDYAVTDEEDLLWKVYSNRGAEKSDPSLRTASEQALEETRRAESIRKAEMASTAKKVDKSVGVIPFQLAEECKEALKLFASKSEQTTFLEMSVENEIISLVSVKTDLEEGAKFESLVSNTEARFLLIRAKAPEGGTWKALLVFSCPEDVHVKTKMILSSSKATVMQKISSEGITIDENVEVRAADEVDEAIERKLAPVSVFTAEGAGAASISRPKAKGRAATRKLTKFVADDD